MSRTVGLALVALGVLICVLGGGMLASGVLWSDLEVGGAALGGVLVALMAGVVVAVGAVVIARSRQGAQQDAEAAALRKLLDIVKTRGQVGIEDVIIELNSDRETVNAYIYRLVGMGVFDGYVNWDSGVLYSSDAASLHDLNQCKNCGGNIAIAGKGVFKCPFCGTEYFTSR